MRSRWFAAGLGSFAALAVLLALLPRGGAQTGARPPARATEAETAGPRGPEGPPPDPLEQAHEQLTLVALLSGSPSIHLPAEDAALLDRTKELYRSAVQARRDGADRRADALAGATAAAAAGLMQAAWASAAPVPGVPEPPEPRTRSASAPPNSGQRPGPEAPARRGDEPPRDASRPAQPQAGGAPMTPDAVATRILNDIRDRVIRTSAEDAKLPAAKPFGEASRRAYEAARQALKEGHGRQATDLALAAEAWTHVGEQLRQADSNRPAVPPGASGPRERLAPPPTPRDR